MVSRLDNLEARLKSIRGALRLRMVERPRADADLLARNWERDRGDVLRLRWGRESEPELRP